MSRLTDPLSTIALALIVLATPAAAQDAAAADGTPQRIRSVTVAPGQACPASTADEVVVCRPAEEPYRIPPGLRDSGPIAAQNQSWVNRAAELDQVGKVAGGLPDTCSPVGTGGASGCALQANRAYAAARRAQQAEAGQVP